MSGMWVEQERNQMKYSKTQSENLWLYLEAVATVDINYIALKHCRWEQIFPRWGLKFGQWEKIQLKKVMEVCTVWGRTWLEV